MSEPNEKQLDSRAMDMLYTLLSHAASNCNHTEGSYTAVRDFTSLDQGGLPAVSSWVESSWDPTSLASPTSETNKNLEHPEKPIPCNCFG